MEGKLQEIIKRIEIIENRNSRVELDKKWEGSKTRIFLICFITYLVAMIYMSFSNTGKPYLSALVPVIGFFLSSLSIPFAKKIWINSLSDRNKRRLE